MSQIQFLDSPFTGVDAATVRAAALTITDRARDADDARMLLEACGLTGGNDGRS